MTVRNLMRALAWLTRDTFRQAAETRILAMMLGLSGLAILLCLSVGIDEGPPLTEPGERPDFLPRAATAEERAKAPREGVAIPSGELTLAFGAFRVPLSRDARDAVHFLRLALAAGMADSAGLLLSLVWTAGFLPAFLAPRAVTVLLAKPIPREALFAGKCLGIVAFVASQAAVFFLGTWLALGLRTRIWDPSYLWALPIFVLQFAVFFGAGALVASTGRRTGACLLAAVLFWLLCWGMNYGRHAVVALPRSASEASLAPSPWLRGAVEAGYWTLPKPADLGMILADAVDAHGRFAGVPEFEAARRLGAFHPTLSAATSLAFAALLLTAAARRFARADY
jgi:hypothetical protein